MTHTTLLLITIFLFLSLHILSLLIFLTFNKSINKQADRLTEQDKIIDDLIKDQEDMEESLAQALVMSEMANRNCQILKQAMENPMLEKKATKAN